MELQTSGLRNSAVLRVITHRPEWQASFRNQTHVTTLQLGGLGKAQGDEIASLLAEGRIGDDILAEIVERTDGIPLFLEELTKSVLEGGVDARVGEIPPTLHGSLLARLDRLRGEAKGLA